MTAFAVSIFHQGLSHLTDRYFGQCDSTNARKSWSRRHGLPLEDGAPVPSPTLTVSRCLQTIGERFDDSSHRVCLTLLVVLKGPSNPPFSADGHLFASAHCSPRIARRSPERVSRGSRASRRQHRCSRATTKAARGAYPLQRQRQRTQEADPNSCRAGLLALGSGQRCASDLANGDATLKYSACRGGKESSRSGPEALAASPHAKLFLLELQCCSLHAIAHPRCISRHADGSRSSFAAPDLIASSSATFS